MQTHVDNCFLHSSLPQENKKDKIPIRNLLKVNQESINKKKRRKKGRGSNAFFRLIILWWVSNLVFSVPSQMMSYWSESSDDKWYHYMLDTCLGDQRPAESHLGTTLFARGVGQAEFTTHT